MHDARPRPNPWLLLPIETKAREFHAKVLQAAVAAERGFDVVVGDQNAMVKNVARLPRGVYLDKSVSRTKTKHFRSLTAIGNRVVACCEEGLVYRDPDTYLHERVSNDSLALADRFFAWGEVQAADVLRKAPEAAAKLRVTGNPRFDILRPDLRPVFAPEVTALQRRFGRYLLVATNFSRYNHFLGYDSWIANLQKRGTIANDAELAFFRRWRDYLGVLFHGFASAIPVLSRAFPNHSIVVRPHPSENHDAWRRLTVGIANVTVAFEDSVVPWIAGADVVVHNSCTTGVEAYLLGRPVVAYRPATDTLLDSRLPHAVSNEAFNEDELVAQVRAGVADALPATEHAESEAARYIAGHNGRLAADRVIDGLVELGINPSLYRPSPGDRVLFRVEAAAARLAPISRRLRVDARADAYVRQKFPGIALAEVNDALDRFRRVTGRFSAIRASAMGARSCYRITSES
ncbi:MAG: hypothetical protein FJX64_06790 [Alphaproteobacteria bacterium]|nr:hypothetical protein [Alphaproteobacteria bacterium]